MTKTCPIHQKELRQFKGIGKVSGKPYEVWKCTYKYDKGYCEYKEWVDQVETTKKFTQTPNGVVETEEVWPVEGDLRPQNSPQTQEEPKSDIRAVLAEILAEIRSLKKLVTSESHNDIN